MDAVVYARVSSDASGIGRSVDQQVAECERVCDAEGWTVTDVLTDIDIGASRHSGGRSRPGFDRLRQILREGMVLVMWESSRGTRRLAEYAEFRDLCAERKVLWNIGGRTYDPNDPNDRMVLTFGAARDEDEVERSRQRILRGVRAHVESGRPWATLPYGYKRQRDPDTGKLIGWVVDDAEAAVLREMAGRALNGELVFRLAKELNARGVPPPGGARTGWTASTLRKQLRNPTYAALRHHQGNVTEGNWPPLWDTATHDRLSGLLAPKQERKHQGREPTSLLSAIAVCGRCGGPMAYRKTSPPRYFCKSGCAARVCDPVDDMARNAVIRFFSSDLGAALLARSFGEDESSSAAAEARQLQDRIDAAADEYADGKLELSELQRITARNRPKIEAAKRRAEQASPRPWLEKFRDADPAEVWEELELHERRAVVRDRVRVTILPAVRGSNTFDRDSVRIELLGEIPVDSAFFNDV